MNPKYPVYIISKGRADTRYTSEALEKIGVPYRIVIEPQEFEDYSAVIDKEKILQLPFSNLGQGSIPARNWCWEHSISEGHEWHWILDDNIKSFLRFTNDQRYTVTSGTIFKCAEDFVQRYENIALSGFQYRFFCGGATQPYKLNTRIYSCLLINNSTPHRWRGRYNEDTDLSLRVLKDGYCTVLFYAFLCSKMETMSCKGGNTEDLYSADIDGRLKMAESLRDQHPDVATIAWKWDRWHHEVDYKPFKKNRLTMKEGLDIPDRVNNYGMTLREQAKKENE